MDLIVALCWSLRATRLSASGGFAL